MPIDCNLFTNLARFEPSSRVFIEFVTPKRHSHGK